MLLLLLTGCNSLFYGEASHSRQLLESATPTADSLSLEIIWIRHPVGDESFEKQVWSAVDEQRFDVATRRHLSRNGFRVGVIGGHVPRPVAAAIANVADEARPAVALDVVPGRARRRVVQLGRSEFCEVQASQTFDELSWLKVDVDGVRGDSLIDAQCVYRTRLIPQRGRMAQVELTPEIQFGPPIRKFSSMNEGIYQIVPTRERKAFDDLRIEASMSAGEMLFIAHVPEMAGSLGHWFHTAEEADARVQKLVVVRLAQVPASDLFQDVAEPPPPRGSLQGPDTSSPPPPHTQAAAVEL